MLPTPEKKRILFIQCGLEPHEIRRPVFDPDQGFVDGIPMAPVTCATLAALTPGDYHVDIWDENLLGTIQENTPLGKYDVVAISLMFYYLTNHARFLGMLFQLRGVKVVVGGPAVSAAPEDFRGYFDAIFINEAERTWPQFLRDLEQGKTQREYRQIEKPSMTESPPPRWGNMAGRIPEYEWGTVQTTRGCPFDCEFCDVIYLFGRRQRHKPVGQVLTEVRTLESLGARGIFFTDDEFVGDKNYAKELLSELIPVNNSFRRSLRLFTQVTLNLSRDEELLALMADANFYSMLAGVETFNKDSLKETHKFQNISKDIIHDLQKIHSYGLGLLGSFVVGFDHDGPGIFDELHDGIHQACVPWAYVTPLNAIHNTKLWGRLRREGRVAALRAGPADDPIRVALNIIPHQMSRVELLEGYRGLIQRLCRWESIHTRLRGWISMVRRPPQSHDEPLSGAVRERFLEEARRTWELSPSEHSDLGDTLGHVQRVAPYLLNRVVFLLLQNHYTRRMYADMFIGYEKLLEKERGGELVTDTRPLLVPASFGLAMTAFFPELYSRLYRSLPDRSMLPEAIKEVFVDFIVRWGTTFEKMEPQHRVFLLELCDRTASKLGGQPASAPREDEPALLAEARKSRLLDAILKDVRDELARMTAA